MKFYETVTLLLVALYFTTVIVSAKILAGCTFDLPHRPFCQSKPNGRSAAELRIGKSSTQDPVPYDYSYQWPFYGNFLVLRHRSEWKLNFNTRKIGNFHRRIAQSTPSHRVCLTFHYFGHASPRVYLATEPPGLGPPKQQLLRWSQAAVTMLGQHGSGAEGGIVDRWIRVQLPVRVAPAEASQSVLFTHEWLPHEDVYLDHVYIEEMEVGQAGCAVPHRHFGCPYDMIPCLSTGRCIPKSLRCDGVSQCGDESDELECGSEFPVEPCPSLNMVQCGNGVCMDKTTTNNNICQGVCKDFTDQLSPECRFTCVNGHFIPFTFRCNGHNDCGDISDESSCSCSSPRSFRCASDENEIKGVSSLGRSQRRIVAHSMNAGELNKHEMTVNGTKSVVWKQFFGDFNKKSGNTFVQNFSDNVLVSMSATHQSNARNRRQLPPHFTTLSRLQAPKINNPVTFWTSDTSQPAEAGNFISGRLTKSSNFVPVSPPRLSGRMPGFVPTSVPKTCIQQSLVCDGVPHCRFGDDEFNCHARPKTIFQKFEK